MTVDLSDGWERHFWLLKQFKKKYGHCDVSSVWPSDSPLALWVDQQQAAQLQHTLKSSKQRRLHGLGLKWLTVARQTTAWDERFQQLQAYKDRFGHCDVPARWADNQLLATWVHNQRARRGTLSAERIRRLESIGFVWQATGRVSYPSEARWDASYEQLADFKKRFGHCDLPGKWAENQPLARWVQTQRECHSRGKLSAERIRWLEAIGFAWHGRGRLAYSAEARWDAYCEQLADFKKRFGHCTVPTQWAENRPLAHWMHNQRSYYRQGKLSAERIRRLEAIGFCWAGR